jgi:hypothetical protein
MDLIKLYICGIIWLLAFNISYSQQSIALSEKNIDKLEKIKSPSKKLDKYRKYYSKDSSIGKSD